MNRLSLKFAIDLTLWLAAVPVAYALRLDAAAASLIPEILVVVAVGGVLKAGMLLWARLPWRSWRRLSLHDLTPIVALVGIYTIFVGAVSLVKPGDLVLPRSVPLIEGMVAILLFGAARVAARVRYERTRRPRADNVRRVVIVGAGEAGTMIAREMLRHPESGMQPVGFLDDDRGKQRQRFLGLSVFGGIDDLPEVADEQDIDEVLIAMPSQDGRVVRQVVDLAREAKCEHRIIPGVFELLSGEVSISQIREVNVEDLLRREPVELDTTPIESALRGKRVLVTGAGGSIGSEIVRQVARFGPERLALLGRGENSVYHIHREMCAAHPRLALVPVITDVRDEESLRRAFDRVRPEVVFHAAAHKHVPLMEANAPQAVFNNVGGTRNVAELALEYGVERLVNVSTDKAVNPTSVMGASKRAAELVVSHAARRCATGQAFVSVRFGNVLGSRGSVVPVFKRQIEQGGPVTVTDPKMQRYFMTIPEASQLVLQAGAMAENGRVYVLDMGEPVKIVDLARDLILLSGLEPGVDVEITFTGARPGEKLFEELLTEGEDTEASTHRQIFVARNETMDAEELEPLLADLFAAAESQSDEAVREALCALLPTYLGAPMHSTPPQNGRDTGGDGVQQAGGTHLLIANRRRMKEVEASSSR